MRVAAVSSSTPPATTSLPPPPLPQVTTARNPKSLLSQCKTIKHVRQLHADIIKTGHIRNPFVAGNLLELLAITFPDAMDEAGLVFSHLEFPVAAHYNVMMRGHTAKDSPRDAIALFLQMLEDPVEPDAHSFSCALKSSSRLFAVDLGEGIHGLVVKFGVDGSAFVRNTLIHAYASFGHVESARKLFDEMPERNVVAWNSMFAGYAKNGDWAEVVRLFGEMRVLDIQPDEVTLICVLTACGRVGDLGLGEWIHGHIEEVGVKPSRNLVTALVDMYGKCGQLDTARRLFDGMPERDVVAWSALISAYNQWSRCRHALALFNEMQIAKVPPNEVTMVSVLSSCAVLGALENGKWVHFYVEKNKLRMTVNLGTALIDFYAKCGSIDNALKVFERMRQRNVLSWSVIIQGLANNGQGREAIAMFSRMQKENVKPNDVTFIGVLSACSHSGLVDEGWRYFASMSKDYGIRPRIEHHGCMVDMLGRAGMIEEAHCFIKNMTIPPNAIVWRTLLASCKVHGNVEVAEDALRHIMKLEPEHSGDYILLSSIYASAGRWEDSLRMRTEMKKRGIKKIPGCSLIEVDGVIHEFFAEDITHPQSKEIYVAVEDMMQKLKASGYVPHTAEARLDADEEDKEISVSHHSEKLAIAFGLIHTSPGTTIRISKNLRVCNDCHSATKMISKVFNREIVVRDRNRFHHFRDGSCSCNDYW
ncbi:Pentatricopeptide repeat-containing protein [Nymphaea thermarum]|nr:Pentatricopeptide repeat-containing protein [Nymphaea thermarum]